MSDFPTALTNAVDGTTEILAKHLNNVEAKIGVDGSANTSSLDYLLKSANSIDPGHKHSDAPGEGHITIIPYAYSGFTQGTWAISIPANATQYLNGMIYNSTAANSDQIDYKAYLAAGIYTAKVLLDKNANRGIMDFLIDGASKGTYDQYNATQQMNQIFTITGISISSSGIKTISLKVNGKNASSSDYYITATCISLFRTA